jgi:hypothetical protein
MDYDTLVGEKTVVGSIKYQINYDRIDSAGILTEAQAWIYSKLRVRQMQTSASVTIAQGASTASFPTGYLDPLHFGIPGFISRIRRKDVEWFRTNLGFDETATLPEGLPTYWTDYNDLIQLNTVADQAYTASMVFFKTPDALSSSNPTNWLTTKYPTLVRRVCTMIAAEARKEFDTFDRDEARALQMIEEIKVESDNSLRGIELDFEWNESY